MGFLISYECTRQIRWNGVLSDTSEVSPGVPQGSHLGLILFLLSINDLVLGLKFVCALLYADYLKVYAIIISLNYAAFFQADLDFLSDWSQIIVYILIWVNVKFNIILPFPLTTLIAVSLWKGSILLETLV